MGGALGTPIGRLAEEEKAAAIAAGYDLDRCATCIQTAVKSLLAAAKTV
jgi:hypothetical protein